MLRSTLAVVVGYLIVGVSAAVLFQVTGQAPHAQATTRFTIWSTVYGVVFSALGGYTAAKLAPRQPKHHAIVVAIMIASAAIASALIQPATASWSQVTALFLMAPAAAAGGLLHGQAR